MRIGFVGIFLSLLLSAPAQAALIVNGDFESGTPITALTQLNAGSTGLTGWTIDSGSIDYIGSFWQAQSGQRSIDLAGTSVGTISQSFATDIGTQYQVNYWISRNSGGGVDPRTGYIQVTGYAAQQFVFTNTGSTQADMKWQQKSYTFTATSTLTKLSFSADSATAANAYGPALDNVTVTALPLPAVPEPATWMMLIGGLFSVGAVVRRQGRRGMCAAV